MVWAYACSASVAAPNNTTGESLKITIRRLVQGASITGVAVFVMAASPKQTTVRSNVALNLVPETVILSLVGGALLGLGRLRRKRRKEDAQC